jgi:hypothetical protein
VSGDRWQSPACPPRGRVGGRESGTRHGGRAPPPPTTTKEGGEPHAAPSFLELQRQVEEDGGCEATDGCFVESDGTCEHGQPSWLLVLGLI